jgi:hypothetical protein
LFGVGLGAAAGRAFFNIGQSAERAEFNLQRFAGTKFDRLRNDFKNIKADIDNIAEGASQVITQKQFDIAATGFVKVFGKGEAQLKAFNQLFTFAAKQAAITGKSVVDIFSEIQSGVQGGGFEGLLDIPGFDIFRKQLLEFQQQAIDPGEPGGRIALQNRLRAVLGVVTEATEDQNSVLKEVPENLIEMDKAGAKTKNTFEELGKTINSLLVPAMKGFNIVLDRFNDLIEVGKGAKTPSGALENIIREILNPREKPVPVSILPGPAPATFPGTTTPGNTVTTGAGTVFHITNTFDIKSTDPKAVAKEAISVFQQSISSAKRSIIKTEE